jgi:outer membrane protein assembly factor BamB
MVGPGPYAMPQVAGDRVITASGTGKVHSIDKKTGKPVWSYDLYDEFNGTRLEFGYACHALVYEDLLIYLARGRGSRTGPVISSPGPQPASAYPSRKPGSPSLTSAS